MPFKTKSMQRRFEKRNVFGVVRDLETQASAAYMSDITAPSLSEFTPHIGRLVIDDELILPTPDSTSDDPTNTGFSGTFKSHIGHTFGATTYIEGLVKAGVLQRGVDTDANELLNSVTNTGFKVPTTVESQSWTSTLVIADINASDNVYASALNTTYLPAELSDFDFGIPSGATIYGIEVTVEFKANISHTGYLRASLSHNDGGAFTATEETYTTEYTDSVFVFGGATETWGRSWTEAEFADGTFRLKIEGKGEAAAGRVYLDYVAVKVYHSTF